MFVGVFLCFSVLDCVAVCILFWLWVLCFYDCMVGFVTVLCIALNMLVNVWLFGGGEWTNILHCIELYCIERP